MAWADLLQDNLREPGGILQTIALPLVFLDRNDARLSHSVWHPFVDRAIFYRSQDGDAVTWATRQIEAFVMREAQHGADNAAWLEEASNARDRLGRRQGLIEGITAVHPVPLSVELEP